MKIVSTAEMYNRDIFVCIKTDNDKKRKVNSQAYSIEVLGQSGFKRTERKQAQNEFNC